MNNHTLLTTSSFMYDPSHNQAKNEFVLKSPFLNLFIFLKKKGEGRGEG